MPNSVYLLQIILKNDLEKEASVTPKIMTMVSRWCKPAMHAKRNIGYVIVSDESLEEISKRLSSGLFKLQELGSIERFFIYPAPEKVISEFGDIDPLMHYIRSGYVEARKRDKPQNMRNRKRWQRRV